MICTVIRYHAQAKLNRIQKFALWAQVAGEEHDIIVEFSSTLLSAIASWIASESLKLPFSVSFYH